ncbi:DALR anticodon-binding domain-containing protein [Kitasatospora sp. NPDC086009]|uniref:DALR anticodon-binding domain-containing protein n=1 Tax=unclassified Kitasatospora TaxID=2633591 RepID=UPI0036EC4EE0
MAARRYGSRDRSRPQRLPGFEYVVRPSVVRVPEPAPPTSTGAHRAETSAVRANRLALCRLTARTSARGLDLFGLQAPDRM